MTIRSGIRKQSISSGWSSIQYHQLTGFRQFGSCKKNKLLDSRIVLHYLNCRQTPPTQCRFCFLLDFLDNKINFLLEKQTETFIDSGIFHFSMSCYGWMMDLERLHLWRMALPIFENYILLNINYHYSVLILSVIIVKDCGSGNFHCVRS